MPEKGSDMATFLGCWDHVGHYFWTPDRTSSLEKPEGCPWPRIDGALTPRSTSEQGAAALHHLDGWTALAVHDYTIDKRPGSNAVFLFHLPELPFENAVMQARLAFPEVVERIGPMTEIE